MLDIVVDLLHMVVVDLELLIMDVLVVHDVLQHVDVHSQLHRIAGLVGGQQGNHAGKVRHRTHQQHTAAHINAKDGGGRPEADVADGKRHHGDEQAGHHFAVAVFQRALLAARLTVQQKAKRGEHHRIHQQHDEQVAARVCRLKDLEHAQIHRDQIGQCGGKFRLHHRLAPMLDHHADMLLQAKAQIEHHGHQAAQHQGQPDGGGLLEVGIIQHQQQGECTQDQRECLPAPQPLVVAQDVQRTDTPLRKDRELKGEEGSHSFNHPWTTPI